jgi:Protein of unknown function (DUF2778)
LFRVSVASVAAVLAGLTAIFSLCAWMMRGSEPAHAGSPAESHGLSVLGTIHPQLLSHGTAALQANLSNAPPVRLASLESTFESRSAPAATENPSDSTATAAIPSFDERFSFDRSAPSSPSLRPVGVRTVVATYRTASLSDTLLPTAYAPGDPATKDSGSADLLKKLTQRDSASNDAARKVAAPKDATPNLLSGDSSHTAIYDISAQTVYLPNGKRLEAHSGLGEYMDDVRSVPLRARGPTPPNVYELKLRESPFHGVQAIRLNPVDGSKMYGRDGILAHPFMLGPNGQSNGCVSVKDYPAFLNAYLRGEITQLVVVERLDDPPSARTAADWFSNMLKEIFGRS